MSGRTIWAVAATLVVACGGASSRDDGGGSGGSNAGTGGNDAGTGGNDAGTGGNDAGTGGNDAGTCQHNGSKYAVGATYPAGDGCNTCTCTESGSLCTQTPCNVCLTIENEYVTASAAAKACDPALDSVQCTKRSPVGLACGCTTFVNPAHAGAEMKLRELEAEYTQAGCGGGIVCGACAEPVSAVCTFDGTCQDFFGDGSGAGGGPSGQAGAPGAAGAAGAAGEGALTSCPEARPAVGTACAGDFTCNYDDTCRCGACCFTTLACRDAVMTLLGSNDACYQVPC